MFSAYDRLALCTVCVAFQGSWEQRHRAMPGMSEALAGMVLSSFEQSETGTCKLAPDLQAAETMGPKNHETLYAASLVKVQMIVRALVCFAFGVCRWATSGEVMGWVRRLPSGRGTLRMSSSPGFLYEFESGPESMHEQASLSYQSPYWTMVHAAVRNNAGREFEEKKQNVLHKSDLDEIAIQS
jgi:hypothetical protein